MGGFRNLDIYPRVESATRTERAHPGRSGSELCDRSELSKVRPLANVLRSRGRGTELYSAGASKTRAASGLEIRDTAECNSALLWLHPPREAVRQLPRSLK